MKINSGVFVSDDIWVDDWTWQNAKDVMMFDKSQHAQIKLFL